MLVAVADPGGGSGGGGGGGGKGVRIPPSLTEFFFTTCLSLKFSHLQDRLLLLNWLTCFLMESHSILPLI